MNSTFLDAAFALPQADAVGWPTIEPARTAYVRSTDALRRDAACDAAAAVGLRAAHWTDGDLPLDAIVLVERDADDDLAVAADDGRQWIIAFSPELIDAVAELVDKPNVQLLCAPTVADRIAALAVALRPVALSEVDVPREAVRLQHLADEVARIATALATAERPVPRFTGSGATSTAATPVGVDDVRAIIRLRRKRDALLGESVFADPAWDMLLDLTAARIEGVQVPVSSLCLAAAVPSTTALRWMQTLFQLGLIERQSDPDDKRRIHIALTDATFAAMSELLGEAKRIGLAML